jgi:hypothetical protein
VRVQFQGRIYVQGPKNATLQRGDKLGEGSVLGCSGSDVVGASSTLTLYEAVGRHPSEAVIAVSPFGLLVSNGGAGD